MKLFLVAVILILVSACIRMPEERGIYVIKPKKSETGQFKLIITPVKEEVILYDLYEPGKNTASECNTTCNAAPCTNECSPTGMKCYGKLLVSCADIDNDGCLEKTNIACMFGCKDNKCTNYLIYGNISGFRPLSYFLKKPLKFDTDNNCTGRLISVVEFNPEGSLCRKNGHHNVGYGFHTPINCCRRYFPITTCTANHGIIIRGIVESSQYHAVGCYTW